MRIWWNRNKKDKKTPANAGVFLLFFSIDPQCDFLLHFNYYEGKISYFTDAVYRIAGERGELPRSHGRRYGYGAGAVFRKRNRFELSGKFNKNNDAVSDV